jgi:phosphatidylglycerophosphatase A
MDKLIESYELQSANIYKRLTTLISNRSFRKNKKIKLQINDFVMNHNIIYTHLIQSMLLKTVILDNLQYMISIVLLLNDEVVTNDKAMAIDEVVTNDKAMAIDVELPDILNTFSILCNSINMYIRIHYI